MWSSKSRSHVCIQYVQWIIREKSTVSWFLTKEVFKKQLCIHHYIKKSGKHSIKQRKIEKKANLVLFFFSWRRPCLFTFLPWQQPYWIIRPKNCAIAEIAYLRIYKGIFDYGYLLPSTSPHPSSTSIMSEYTVRVSLSHVFNNPRQVGAHKLIGCIVFLFVLKTSASNGSKNKKW